IPGGAASTPHPPTWLHSYRPIAYCPRAPLSIERIERRHQPPRRSRVLTLAAECWGGGRGVACEECLPRSRALGHVPERTIHLAQIPAPRPCEQGDTRGVEPGGNRGLGQALQAPAQDEGHDGLA